MKIVFQVLCAAALCASSITFAAVDSDDAELARSTQVAGRSLRLNGAGLSQRFVFKVYSIGLYLPEPRHTAAAVLDDEGPSRISILLLRDVSSLDFAKGIADSVASRGAASDSEPGAAGIVSVGMAITSLPQGLRKGDRLTIDWVPGVGTVIELNRRPLMAPNADRSFYRALLKIWLGAKPADADLKTQLLGAA